MPDYHYLILNKPRGCITACRDDEQKTVMEYLPKEFHDTLRPVGRLDKDTEGLLLFTDDGNFNQYLMRPENHMPKTYFFWAMGSLGKDQKKQLEHGVLLRGTAAPTAPAKLEILNSGEITDILPLLNLERQPGILKNPANTQVISGLLTITEGKKHQVRRMLKAVGCYVVYLKRISIGKLKLDKTLAPGEWRFLTEKELSLLYPQ